MLTHSNYLFNNTNTLLHTKYAQFPGQTRCQPNTTSTKILDESNKDNRVGVREAKNTKVGRNYIPTEADGRAIEEGISYAIAGRTVANM